MAYQRNGYWYRSVRDGDQVRTEYLGAGPLAEAIATLDALKREERELEWAEARTEREAQKEIDRTIDAVGDLVRVLTHAVLLVNGYHVHKGQWRKRRHGRDRESLPVARDTGTARDIPKVPQEEAQG